MEVQRHVARVSEMRQLIQELGDEAPEHELRDLLDEAERELRNIRRVADLVLRAFFEGGKPKDRESKRVMYASLLLQDGSSCDRFACGNEATGRPLPLGVGVSGGVRARESRVSMRSWATRLSPAKNDRRRKHNAAGYH